MTHSNDNEWDEIDECSIRKSEPNLLRKYSLNQKTQKLMTNFSKMRLPQFLKKPWSRKEKNESSDSKRPVSLYCESYEDVPVNLTQYMKDSTILMALRETEIKLLESENHTKNLELKLKSLEKEIEYLEKENKQQIVKERVLLLQIQEFERRNQTKEAECQEMSLNARIREMELSSEIATLSQKLAAIDTEKQERQIHKIMESQNRIMEQTLPYTMSSENIYDTEDGLFNNTLFEEVVKEQSELLDKNFKNLRRPSDKSEDSIHFQDPDDYVSSLD